MTVSTTVLTLHAKNTLFFIILSKIAEIHVWNKLNLYKLAPLPTQIFSVIKSNFNFQLTVNVMDRIMSTSIILLDQNSNANDVDIKVFEPCNLFRPAAAWGD